MSGLAVGRACSLEERRVASFKISAGFGCGLGGGELVVETVEGLLGGFPGALGWLMGVFLDPLFFCLGVVGRGRGFGLGWKDGYSSYVYTYPVIDLKCGLDAQLGKVRARCFIRGWELSCKSLPEATRALLLCEHRLEPDGARPASEAVNRQLVSNKHCLELRPREFRPREQTHSTWTPRLSVLWRGAPRLPPRPVGSGQISQRPSKYSSSYKRQSSRHHPQLAPATAPIETPETREGPGGPLDTVALSHLRCDTTRRDKKGSGWLHRRPLAQLSVRIPPPPLPPTCYRREN